MNRPENNPATSFRPMPPTSKAKAIQPRTGQMAFLEYAEGAMNEHATLDMPLAQ